MTHEKNNGQAAFDDRKYGKNVVSGKEQLKPKRNWYITNIHLNTL